MSAAEDKFQSDLLRPWLTRAEGVIERRLRDARNAADNALLVDSNDRLNELGDALADILRQARGEFYAKSFPAQWATLDPEIVDPTVGPTHDGREAAQTVPILDDDQAATLRRMIETARRELALTVGATVNRPLSRPTLIRDWEMRHTALLTMAARMALVNAQVALYHAIGKIMIRKELQ